MDEENGPRGMDMGKKQENPETPFGHQTSGVLTPAVLSLSLNRGHRKKMGRGDDSWDIEQAEMSRKIPLCGVFTHWKAGVRAAAESNLGTASWTVRISPQMWPHSPSSVQSSWEACFNAEEVLRQMKTLYFKCDETEEISRERCLLFWRNSIGRRKIKSFIMLCLGATYKLLIFLLLWTLVLASNSGTLQLQSAQKVTWYFQISVPDGPFQKTSLCYSTIWSLKEACPCWRGWRRWRGTSSSSLFNHWTRGSSWAKGHCLQGGDSFFTRWVWRTRVSRTLLPNT